MKNIFRNNYTKFIIIFLILIVFVLLNTYFGVKNNKKILVTAHRGASLLYPENTMSAFIGAKELGAKWIELDVQQTKDRQIVVSHDSNIKRVTGIDRNIIDMNYFELKEFDFGSFFNEKFKDERIPLLDEVLVFAKNNNINLNIELKPNGREINFEKQVIDLIKKYNYENKCVVASFDYNAIKNVKKIDKDIKTVYLMSSIIDDIETLNYADVYSIESSIINKDLVTKIHNLGKEIYAWTVNTKKGINKMINLNVDNIITDDVKLANELVNVY